MTEKRGPPWVLIPYKVFVYNETSCEYKKIVGHNNGRLTIRAEELKKQAKIKEIGKKLIMKSFSKQRR